MNKQWQPEQYIIWSNTIHVICKVLSDNKLIIQDYNKTLPPHVVKIKDDNSIYKPIRPAVLDDFAVKIPDYGKVWFIEADDCIESIAKLDNGITSITMWEKEDKYDMWDLAGVKAHYNITVMPEELFMKLSEADNGVDS